MKETKEQAAHKYARNVNLNHTSHMLGFINGAKWQAEKMYSEEDMRESFGASDEGWASFSHWLEQYKKK